MNIVLRHYGKIVNGKKTYYNPSLYQETINSLEGQEFEEVIKKRHRKITNDQYAYFYGGVLKTAHQHEAFFHFNTVEDILDDVIAPMFLKYTKVVTVGSESWTERKIRKLSSLSKDEMRELIDRTIAWLATDFGVIVLSPDEYYLNS